MTSREVNYEIRLRNIARLLDCTVDQIEDRILALTNAEAELNRLRKDG